MTRRLLAALAAFIIVSGCTVAGSPARADVAPEIILAANTAPLPPKAADRAPVVAPAPVFLAAPAAAAPAPVVNVTVPEQPAPTVVVQAPAPAPATKVVVTWGDWVSELAKLAAGLAAPLGLFFLSMVKGLPGVMLRAYLTEAKINELAGYAVNATAGAMKDRALTVDLGNEVLATAVRYALDNLPQRTIAMLGGVEGIRSKVLAKLNLEADATADALSA